MEKTPPDMKVRMSPELRQKVEASARASNRTMNGEIIARLEASYVQNAVVGRPGLTQDQIADLAGEIAALKERVDSIFLDPLMDELSALQQRVAKLERKK